MFHCRFQVFFLFVCLSVLSNKHLKPAKNRREEPTGNKTFVLTFACFTFFHAQKEARTSTLTTHNNKVASQVKPNMLKHQRLREFGCYTFKPWQAQYFRSKHGLPRKTFLRATGPATPSRATNYTDTSTKKHVRGKPAVQCHKFRTKRSPSVGLESHTPQILRLPPKSGLNGVTCPNATATSIAHANKFQCSGHLKCDKWQGRYFKSNYMAMLNVQIPGLPLAMRKKNVLAASKFWPQTGRT